MAKTEVTAVQVQMAAAAGVKLMQVDDLPVPLSVAKSGALGILEGMLQALASGEVMLVQPPAPPAAPPAAPEKKAVPDKAEVPPIPEKEGGNGEDSPPAE